MAEDEEDVWVAPVAKPAVAESRVALVVDEPNVVFVRLLKGKKRRLTVAGEDDTEVMTAIPVEEERAIVVAPLGPRLDHRGIPVGPRLRDGPRVRGWDVVRREYRFVDWSLVDVRNGMVLVSRLLRNPRMFAGSQPGAL